MAQLTYEKEITGLVLIDPYNDFISEGGKIWDRIKGVAEGTSVFLICSSFLKRREKPVSGCSTRCIGDIVVATTRLGSTSRPFRKQRGRVSRSNTVPGAAKSGPGSNLSRAMSSPRSIGVPAALPTRIWICNSRSTAFTKSSSWD